MDNDKIMEHYYENCKYLNFAFAKTQLLIQNRIRERVQEIDNKKLGDNEIFKLIKLQAKDNKVSMGKLKNIDLLSNIDISAGTGILLHDDKYKLNKTKDKEEINLLDNIRMAKNKYTSHASQKEWLSTEMINIRHH